ncbi:putative Ig domain-containing protein [Paenarthrobacter nitroguajacolicus]|uniref:RCC1 domain-containing protein n=2 Tax=Paenarthrobacter nitroguajacolicus TaxID=211146 RepID=UPI003DA020E6
MLVFSTTLRAVFLAVLVVSLCLMDVAPGLALGRFGASMPTVDKPAQVSAEISMDQDSVTFADVPSEAQFFTEIQWLASEGISTGWLQPDGQRIYQPQAPVARDAMAAFMYRFARLPDYPSPAASPFADITNSTQFYKEMAWLSAQGISTGWTESDGSKTYRPLNPVNRDAMAAFLYRLAGSPVFTPPSTPPFADVPVGAQFYKEITWLASSNITTGWAEADGSKSFRPLTSVARDAMAAFMYRFRQLLTGHCPSTYHLSGNLTHALALDPACSALVVLDGDYTIDKGASLTVPEGTTMTAAAGARLIVKGSVVFEGTQSAPISLKSTADHRGLAFPTAVASEVGGQSSATESWGGIRVEWGGHVSATHLNVRDAPVGITALASPTAEATTRLEIQATSISQAETCLSLQGPVVGHFHGSVSDCSTGVVADYPFDASQVQWGTGIGPGDGTDGHPAVDGHDINVFPWTGAAPLPQPADNVPDSRNLPCGDYYFIGMMGSGERGDPTPEQYLGPRVQDVYTKFKTTILETKPTAVIQAHGIDYPANAVPFSTWKSASIQSLAEYVPGAWQGALSLLDTLSQREQKCGLSNEKTVLTGYSQGAWAIHVALNYAEAMERLNAANKINLNRISAVGLLADPLRRYDGNEIHLGTATMGSGIANVLKLGGTLYSFADWAAARTAGSGLPAPDINTPMSSMLFGSSLPGTMLSKTASYCNENDPVCSWGETANLPDFSIHSYAETTDRAHLGQWLAQTPTTNAPIGIVATSLPAGVVGQRYHFALKAYDGAPPYSWTLTGALPAGLYFDSYNGVIAGVPTASGTAAVGITVKDDNAGSSGPANTTLSVNPPSTPPAAALSGIKEISTAGNFAVLNDGTVWAWGSNNVGQLGNDTAVPSSKAIQVPSLGNVRSVTSNGSAAFALKNDGTVWGWGSNSCQQLGAETSVPTLPPTQMKGLSGIVSVASNGCVVYALKSDGTVWSWGYNFGGLLGRGLDPNAVPYHPDPTPIPELSGVVKIVTDGSATFAVLSDGSVMSWGATSNHQLGRYTYSTTEAALPGPLLGLTGVSDVVVRQNSTGSSLVIYALTTGGNLWAWGRGAPGGDSVVPIQVQGIGRVTQVASNGEATLATADGQLWSWGWGAYGLLGNGSQKESSIPIRVPVAGKVTAVDISGGGVFVVTEDGGLWTWGMNDLGLLGIGNQTAFSYSFEPRRVEHLPEIHGIARNYATAYALTADGTALAWGYNANGNTGTGLSAQFLPTPTPVQR